MNGLKDVRAKFFDGKKFGKFLNVGKIKNHFLELFIGLIN
jgi:hypothetical protein